MTIIYFDLEDGSQDDILLETGTYKLLNEGSEPVFGGGGDPGGDPGGGVGTPISNTNSTSSGLVRSNYEIDDRTGFKKYPSWHPLSKVVIDGYGWRTDKPDDRHPQDFVKSRGNDKADGPQFAEPDVVYLSSTVSPEDL